MTDERDVIREIEDDWRKAIQAIRDEEVQRTREFRAAIARNDKRWTRVAVALCVVVGIFAATATAAIAIIGHQADRLDTIIHEQRGAAKDQQRESRERIDQICTLFERSHLTDVQQLRKTYVYLLATMSKPELETLNSFILAALPTQEQQARTDTAPPFCDEPYVGLPEPDPKIPARPPALRALSTAPRKP